MLEWAAFTPMNGETESFSSRTVAYAGRRRENGQLRSEKSRSPGSCEKGEVGQRKSRLAVGYLPVYLTLGPDLATYQVF
jgi:hypothetical protein